MNNNYIQYQEFPDISNMKYHKYNSTQSCVKLSEVSHAEPSENQISAHQVIGTNIPKTLQHADFSIQKLQSR